MTTPFLLYSRALFSRIAMARPTSSTKETTTFPAWKNAAVCRCLWSVTCTRLPLRLLSSQGRPRPMRMLITCDPVALPTAMDPYPRRATVTDCTVSGISAPTATSTMPNTMKDTPDRSTHRSTTAEMMYEKTATHTKEVMNVTGYHRAWGPSWWQGGQVSMNSHRSGLVAPSSTFTSTPMAPVNSGASSSSAWMPSLLPRGIDSLSESSSSSSSSSSDRTGLRLGGGGELGGPALCSAPPSLPGLAIASAGVTLLPPEEELGRT
mmetsp:Transcript_27037/g.86945  ORF Transcript_27037/g.86945 Transcript_27037/m.86945 type:complete len:264 (-) Transcript_27037:481-1272(-)